MNKVDGWEKIIKSIEVLEYRYEVGTELIGAFLPFFTRRLLTCLYEPEKVILDVGAGTGALSRTLLSSHRAYLVMVDVSRRLMEIAIEKMNRYDGRFDAILASSEMLPIRAGAIEAIYTSFVFRDVIDHKSTLLEFKRVLIEKGKWLSVDMGKPDDRIRRDILLVLLRLNIMLFGKLLSLDGGNPWKLLIYTLHRVPSNNILYNLIREIFPLSKMFSFLGGFVYINISAKS
jgi:ubiquinone/menaquinone biosynthesis C-methylase UbiE